MDKPTRPDLGRALTVGEVAARSGLAVSALRFYEAQGLIRASRTGGNQRRYSRDVLRRVSIIKVAQRVGVPLAAIREAFQSLPAGRVPSAADWRRLSAKWRADLDERIAQLERLRDQLGKCIGCGCLSIENCWLRNPWDKLGAQGPGARLLEGKASRAQRRLLPLRAPRLHERGEVQDQEKRHEIGRDQHER